MHGVGNCDPTGTFVVFIEAERGIGVLIMVILAFRGFLQCPSTLAMKTKLAMALLREFLICASSRSSPLKEFKTANQQLTSWHVSFCADMFSTLSAATRIANRFIANHCQGCAVAKSPNWFWKYIFDVLRRLCAALEFFVGFRGTFEPTFRLVRLKTLTGDGPHVSVVLISPDMIRGVAKGQSSRGGSSMPVLGVRG